eukprot:scaffold317571_cov19-Tisochrysis_lutea.AAC.1
MSKPRSRDGTAEKVTLFARLAGTACLCQQLHLHLKERRYCKMRESSRTRSDAPNRKNMESASLLADVHAQVFILLQVMQRLPQL